MSAAGPGPGAEIGTPETDTVTVLNSALARFSAAELDTIADAKRAWERLLASPALRAGPADALGPHAPLHALASGRPLVADGAHWPEIDLFVEWRKSQRFYRDALRRLPEAAGANPRFVAWRRREMARAASELGTRDAAITHPAIAYELSSGCSVGCWFCGISAGSFRRNATYADDSALWRDMLEVVAGLLGPAARTGVCFGATDPFDNPDYDCFAADHKAITGSLPSTTTAIPLRDPAMTRALLRRSETDGPVMNRFSVLTTRTMEDVLATWTARELLMVDLVPQMAGSLLPKARAGRVLERSPRTASIDELATTIACVTGFLVNLPERRVRLVSPCAASRDWPLGFRIYADAHFNDAVGLLGAMQAMMDSIMDTDLPLARTLRFRPDLHLTQNADGIRMQNGVTVHDVAGRPFLPELTTLLACADRPLRTIIGQIVAGGAPFFELLQILHSLYDAALLEPADLPRAMPDRSTTHGIEPSDPSLPRDVHQP